MNLDMYKLPLGLTDGVVISLPHTDITFTVILPASSNEEFQAKLISSMNMHIDPEAANFDMDFDAGRFATSHKSLFFENCIKSAKGLPKGITVPEFFAEYPLAARYVYDKAVALSSKADEEVNLALGKSGTTLVGKSSGKAA